MDRAEFIQAFQVVEEFLGLDYSQEKIEVIYRRVQHHDPDQLQAAVMGLIEQRIHPGDKQNILPFLLEQLEPKGKEEDAERVALRLIRLRDDIGRYRTPSKEQVSDDEAKLIFELGGWVAVCNMPDEELKWAVKNLFKGGYTPLREERPVLSGLHDKQNYALEGMQNLKQILQESESESEATELMEDST